MAALISPGHVNRTSIGNRINRSQSTDWIRFIRPIEGQSKRKKNVNSIGFDRYSINFDWYSISFNWTSISFDWASIELRSASIELRSVWTWSSISFNWSSISFDWTSIISFDLGCTWIHFEFDWFWYSIKFDYCYWCYISIGVIPEGNLNDLVNIPIGIFGSYGLQKILITYPAPGKENFPPMC